MDDFPNRTQAFVVSAENQISEIIAEACRLTLGIDDYGDTMPGFGERTVNDVLLQLESVAATARLCQISVRDLGVLLNEGKAVT
jgi:hypothetical protein